MYTNDKWCVENIWNSEEMITNREYLQRRMTEIQGEEELLMRDRSVPRALLPPQNQVEDLARLRDENFTLAQQVKELRQQITKIEKQADGSLKENQRILQDAIEQYQQEMKQSNTRLQETQSQLRESDTRLQETQSQLRESDTRLQESDTRLQETQSQLRESDTRLQETQSQLRESNTRLQETQSQLRESDTRLQDTQAQLQLTQQDCQQQIQVMVCNSNPKYNNVYIYKYSSL